MSLIRPELRAAAWRGREMLVGLGAALLGSWAVLGSYGVLRWLGYAGLAAGVGLAVAGWQRMRLRPRDEGQGVVEVDEGRITFWGPLSGGSVSRDALQSIALDHGNRPATWVLKEFGDTAVHIPVNAAGQDALLDAFDALPGLSSRAVLTALETRDGKTHILWYASGSVDTTQHSPHL